MHRTLLKRNQNIWSRAGSEGGWGSQKTPLTHQLAWTQHFVSHSPNDYVWSNKGGKRKGLEGVFIQTLCSLPFPCLAQINDVEHGVYIRLGVCVYVCICVYAQHPFSPWSVKDSCRQERWQKKIAVEVAGESYLRMMWRRRYIMLLTSSAHWLKTNRSGQRITHINREDCAVIFNYFHATRSDV